MSRRPSTLMDSAAFRRRMRGVQARAVRLEAEAEAQGREWRLIIERRRREKAAFEALELGAGRSELQRRKAGGLVAVAVVLGGAFAARRILALKRQFFVSEVAEDRVRHLRDHAQSPVAKLAGSSRWGRGAARFQRGKPPFQLVNAIRQGRQPLPKRHGFEGFDNV